MYMVLVEICCNLMSPTILFLMVCQAHGLALR